MLWTFNKGTRKFVKKGSEDMPLKRKEWYAMKIKVQGTNLEGYLNGRNSWTTRSPNPSRARSVSGPRPTA